LLKRPPLCPTNLTPENVYFGVDLMLLRAFLKVTLHCKGKEDFEKAVKGFSDPERSKVSELLQQARDMGFYPEAVTETGIDWGVALKGDIEIAMERNARRYEKIGEELGGDRLQMIKSYLANARNSAMAMA
jgi:hypothetical protein